MTETKDTTIQLRASSKEKQILESRAQQLFMSLSEYLIHAGICYQPSPEVQASLKHFEAKKHELEQALEQHNV